jgi:hypothetical protein
VCFYHSCVGVCLCCSKFFVFVSVGPKPGARADKDVSVLLWARSLVWWTFVRPPLPAACRRRRPRAVPSFSPTRHTVRVKKEGTKHLPGRGKGNTIPPRPWHRQRRRPPLPSFSGGAAQSTPVAVLFLASPAPSRLLTAGPHCASSGPLHLLPLCSTHIARPASTLPRRSSLCS